MSSVAMKVLKIPSCSPKRHFQNQHVHWSTSGWLIRSPWHFCIPMCWCIFRNVSRGYVLLFFSNMRRLNYSYTFWVFSISPPIFPHVFFLLLQCTPFLFKDISLVSCHAQADRILLSVTTYARFISKHCNGQTCHCYNRNVCCVSLDCSQVRVEETSLKEEENM